jgi:chaperone modulatory protein CbpM
MSTRPKKREPANTYALVLQRGGVTVPTLDLDTFSQRASLHPDLVRRLVTLGLLEATADPSGELHFRQNQLAAAARLERLRTGLAINYAALGLVADLLDRIAALEDALHHTPQRTTLPADPRFSKSRRAQSPAKPRSAN